MQKEPVKNISLIDKIGIRNLVMGLTGMILLLVGIFYYSSKNKRYQKAEQEQSISKPADSVLMEKLGNQDTITSLQDPVDTSLRK